MPSLLAPNCLLAILAVLAVTSITTLGLKITSYNFISQYSDIALDLDPSSNNPKLISSLPPHLYNSQLNLVVADTIISLVSASIVFIFTLCTWANREKTRTLPPQRVYLVLSINALLSLITLIYALTTHLLSAHFEPEFQEPFGPTSSYTNGTFDLETWTCNMATDKAHASMYAPQCRLERGARSMVIIGFVFSLITLAVAAWALKGEKKNWQDAVEMKKARNRPFGEEDDDE